MALLSYAIHAGRLQQVLSNLLEEALVEVSPRAEEDFFGSGLLAIGVFKRSEFYAARIVGNLLESVIGGTTVFVNDNLHAQNVFECRVKDARNLRLPVVVIDLDLVKGLEEVELSGESPAFNINNAGGIPRPLFALSCETTSRYLLRLDVFSQDSCGTELIECRCEDTAVLTTCVSPVCGHAISEADEYDDGNSLTVGCGSLKEDRSICTTKDFIHGAQKSGLASLVKPFAAKLSQVVLLKGAPLAKEGQVCSGRSVVVEFDGGQFDGADVVGNLQKNVVARLGISVNDRILGKHVFDGVVDGLGHYPLPVIVVDLDDVESLKVLDVVKKEVCEVSSHHVEELLVTVESLLLICERFVAERQMRKHDSKRAQIAFASGDIEPPVVVIPVEERAKVQRDGDEPPVRKVDLIGLEGLCHALALAVEHKCDEVITGRFSSVARFVYEDGELAHGIDLLQIKSAGGNPPALGGRPLREDHLFYTTRKGIYSSGEYSKHTFVTQIKTCGKRIKNTATEERGAYERSDGRIRTGFARGSRAAAKACCPWRGRSRGGRHGASGQVRHLIWRVAALPAGGNRSHRFS